MAAVTDAVAHAVAAVELHFPTIRIIVATAASKTATTTTTAAADSFVAAYATATVAMTLTTIMTVIFSGYWEILDVCGPTVFRRWNTVIRCVGLQWWLVGWDHRSGSTTATTSTMRSRR